MTRIREVFDAEQVAHLWANGRTDGGKSARNAGGNFSYAGDILRSYTSTIGRKVRSGNRHESRADDFRPIGYLVTTHTYSVTTSKQMGYLRQAIRNAEHVFHVPNLSVEDSLNNEAAHTDNLNAYVRNAAQAHDKASRARANRDSLLIESDNYLSEARAYAAFFHLPKKLTKLIPATAENAAQSIAEARERNAQAIKRAKAKTERELKPVRAFVLAHVLPAWRAGKPSLMPVALESIGVTVPQQIFTHYQSDGAIDLLRNIKAYLRGDYLRVVDDGNTVETSAGAQFPFAHALRALGFVLSLNGREYHRNGHTCHVGHFTIDSVDAAGNVTAGCHNVACGELAAFLASLPTDDQTRVNDYRIRYTAAFDRGELQNVNAA